MEMCAALASAFHGSLQHALLLNRVLLIGKLFPNWSLSCQSLSAVSVCSQTPCREDTLAERLSPLLIHRKQILTRCECSASKGGESMGSSGSSPNQAFSLFCHIFRNFPQGVSNTPIINKTWN